MAGLSFLKTVDIADLGDYAGREHFADALD
jgi:hypothetical protein